MTNNSKIEYEKQPWYLNEYLIGFLVTAIVFFLVKLIESELKDLVLHILIAVAFGSISISIMTLRRIRQDNKSANDFISGENIKENEKILEIVTKNIEQKLYRKLVSTNAIISNRDDKLALTARIIDDFPSLSDIKNGQAAINPETSESIDLVRMLSYQNLILTPKYLDYFFYRKDSVKKASRIVVLDKDQLNGKICQATLTYLFLSARYGYETYIIPELRFKAFLNIHCKIDGKSAVERNKQEETLKMIKGNPFILKTNNGAIQYSGEYTDFQTNYENYGLKKSFTNSEYWDLLQNLINNSIKIEPESSGFADIIKTKIATLSTHQLT